ncbi:hypothetical protein GW12_19530 [Acinetobacter sp. HR7]|nr:hypothetical protein GW12_19530 [Acinetobacter sp. HR7]
MKNIYAPRVIKLAPKRYQIRFHGTVFGNGIFTSYPSVALIMNAKTTQIQVSIKICTTGEFLYNKFHKNAEQ